MLCEVIFSQHFFFFVRMMDTVLVLIFVLGYVCIAFEHRLRIDKSAIALLMFGVIWSVYACCTPGGSSVLVGHLGNTCETLIFLIGAMTIVEIIDSRGGFSIVTERITTRHKWRLLWVLAVTTFFLSAILDNMTTTIILIMMLRRIVPDSRDRVLYASVIVIAANSGGAWSPIGDVSTIMLWMRGNVTAAKLVLFLFIPCVVSLLVPVWCLSRRFDRHGVLRAEVVGADAKPLRGAERRFGLLVLVLGVSGLLFVPIFKSLTGLPPYVGVMISLGVLWALTELFCDHTLPDNSKHRVSKLVKRIDIPVVLFLLGVLMSVAGLQSAGILSSVAHLLDTYVHEVFIISGIVGLFSSVIDNVSLVAACIGMFPIADFSEAVANVDPLYALSFVQDGIFWLLLAYCAGVGGSMLIIGSAAGVVAMGLEKIDFVWYLRHITPAMLAGYFSGMAMIFLEWWVCSF